jgi:hypothetical protein
MTKVRTRRVAAFLAPLLAASATSSAPPLEVAVSRSGSEWTADRRARRRRCRAAQRAPGLLCLRRRLRPDRRGCVRRPFDAFVRSLVDANRRDKVVTREEGLATLDRASGEPSLSADIGRLIDRGAADPKAAIASLFTRAGVAFTLGEDGTPRLR